MLALALLHVAADILNPAVIVRRVDTRGFHDHLDGLGYRRWSAHARRDGGERNEVAAVSAVTVDLDVDIVQIPEQLRMDSLHVVAFVESVDGSFPVAIPFHGDVTRLHHLVELVWIQVMRDGIEKLRERRRA